MTRAALAALSLLTLSSAARAIEAQPASVGGLPPGVDVVEKLGDRVPLDLPFTDERGRKVKLGDYFKDGKPVVLALVYYRCPMLCSLTLNGLVGALRAQGWKLGQEYRVVSLSFDPKETPALALPKQDSYLHALNAPREAANDWPFLTGEQRNIERLADAVGFRYRWDEETKQYDHLAALVTLAADGKVTRYLYGVQFPVRDVRLAIFEAARGRVGTAVERALLRCYRYDPSTKSYTLFATRFVRVGSLAVLAVLSLFLYSMWRRELGRRNGGRV